MVGEFGWERMADNTRLGAHNVSCDGTRTTVMPRLLSLLLIATIIAAGCTSSEEAEPDPITSVDLAAIGRGEIRDFGPPPEYPDGPWSTDTAATLGAVVGALEVGANPTAEFQILADSGDPRLAWALADLQRFIRSGPIADTIASTISQLIGIELDPIAPWRSTVDHMIAWDIPAPPQYFTFKRDFYGRFDPRWEELFSDINTIDWRHVSWGGVGIDDRPAGSTESCSCIPALDDPPVTSAAEGDWYPDDRIVFGVIVEDESRAYPKNIMEVHEMVNDTLGGRRIGIPYCTLCGSAQAYLTDELGDEFEQPVFRTSGLLIRSNKMMYELTSKSFIDTFLGNANSGPMAAAGVTFNQVSVITTTWGDWKAAHPETTILTEDGGLGRSYDLDPLRGRDDNGPIFPIGSTDARLPVQEPVLGVVDDEGNAIAFHVATARDLLASGERIVVEGYELGLDGGGLRATRVDGRAAGGHQSFWFAWSQFQPRTKLWPHDFQPEGEAG